MPARVLCLLLLGVPASLISCSAPPRDAARASEAAQPERPHAPLIAELRLEDWEEDARPIVRIFDDGLVQCSRDLIRGGGSMSEARLSPTELESVKDRLRRVTDGLVGRRLSFGMAVHSRYYAIAVTPVGESATLLQTSIPYQELEFGPGTHVSGGRVPLVLADRDESRFGLLSAGLDTFGLAQRVAWLEIESELLRATSMAQLPEPTPEPRREPPHLGSD